MYCEEIFIQREIIIELNDVIDWLGTKLGHPWLHQPDRFLRERVLGSHSGQDGEGRHIQPEWAGYQGLGPGQGGSLTGNGTEQENKVPEGRTHRWTISYSVYGVWLLY